mmetsp:Transcript_5067/g.7570  ORF Transcript_5067/g.7570 Transcript_5067/m.7570 type:complete len:82 (+) Transcript_5067:30-275(+)
MYNYYYTYKLLSSCDNSNLQQAICWLLVSRLGAFQKHIVTVINPREVEILFLSKLEHLAERDTVGLTFAQLHKFFMTSMFG